jgi:hypothetical protein
MFAEAVDALSWLEIQAGSVTLPFLPEVGVSS